MGNRHSPFCLRGFGSLHHRLRLPAWLLDRAFTIDAAMPREYSEGLQEMQVRECSLRVSMHSTRAFPPPVLASTKDGEKKTLDLSRYVTAVLVPSVTLCPIILPNTAADKYKDGYTNPVQHGGMQTPLLVSGSKENHALGWRRCKNFTL